VYTENNTRTGVQRMLSADVDCAVRLYTYITQHSVSGGISRHLFFVKLKFFLVCCVCCYSFSPQVPVNCCHVFSVNVEWIILVIFQQLW